MKIHVKIETGDGPRTLELRGRAAWALCELKAAGRRGVTVLERPAPRWSSYVHKLRGHGIHVDTEIERHGGPFPGNHGRYRLATDVEIEVPE